MLSQMLFFFKKGWLVDVDGGNIYMLSWVKRMDKRNPGESNTSVQGKCLSCHHLKYVTKAGFFFFSSSSQLVWQSYSIHLFSGILWLSFLTSSTLILRTVFYSSASCTAVARAVNLHLVAFLYCPVFLILTYFKFTFVCSPNVILGDQYVFLIHFLFN